MKTIHFDSLFFIKFIRNSKFSGFYGHSLMESRVEHSDLGNFRGRRQGNLDSQEVGRIVEWSQVDAGFDVLD